MSTYESRQRRATKQLGKYAQGVITYLARGSKSGDAWKPTIATDTSHTLNGVVKGVSKEYVDGSHIVSTDLQATVEVFDVVPVIESRLDIDGEIFQIKKIVQLPAAGTPIAWRLIIGS